MTRAAFFSIVLIALLPAIASATPVSPGLFTTFPADPAGVNAT